MMQAISLQSGSNGNCYFVRSNGSSLLIDAGISGIQAERRLADHNINIRDIDALIVSHDHADHISCAGVYHRKYGLPVYISQRTYEYASRYRALGRIDDLYFFRPGDTLRFGNITVETIPTPHDASDGSAIVVVSGDNRLGILTDLGHVFDGLNSVISSLNAVFLESNYDPRMLETGPYPSFLKKRIKGPGGHISNIESAELLCSADSGRMQWACLAHLSENNNEPEIALRTNKEIAGSSFPVFALSRYSVSEVHMVTSSSDQLALL